MPTLHNDPLSLAFSDVLLDRQARNQTPATLRWYSRCVNMLGDFLRAQNVRTCQLFYTQLHPFSTGSITYLLTVGI